MSRFVERPNLPGMAEAVLIGEKYAEILEKSLEKQGITVIKVPNNPDIDPRLSGHADLSLLHAGGEGIFLAPYLRGTELSRRLEAMGAKLYFPDIRQTPAYPGDAQMNLCAVGDRLFYNVKTAAHEIVNYFTNGDIIKPQPVRQGYTRCGLCPAGDRAVITADSGLAAAAASAGLDALRISPGHILLEGFEYGFIGGASFMLSRERIAFTGSLDGHPDKRAMLEFLAKHGIEPVFLTGLPIFDIGSAIPLTEAG